MTGQGSARQAAEQARAAAEQAQAAADQARAGAEQARATAEQARAAAQQAGGADVPAPAQEMDGPLRINGITFGDGHPPITADFVNGNVVLHQGEQTTSIPLRDVIPRGAVQIAWAVPATLSILLIWWPLTRAFIRRMGRTQAVARDNGALQAELAERFALMERNIDTVAIEVERLSEGQRFTNKLIAERPLGEAVPVSSTGRS